MAAGPGETVVVLDYPRRSVFAVLAFGGAVNHNSAM